ncbi:MAG: hypothetical protein U9O66_01430 [Patescibacteria group bacterium]|nr:hypothetical protein [Patescibacteria group bacterium]
MFGFKKQKKEEEKTVSETTETKVVVHTMPDKFRNINSSGQKSGKFLNIVIFLVILLIVGSSSLYFFKDRIFPGGIPFLNNNNEKENNNNININNNSNNNADNNINSNIGLNMNYNANDNSNVNVNKNTNTNVNSNINQNININRNIERVPIALDSDKDTMPNIEELIYKTDMHNQDSDGDAYMDGQEVANLYNPLIGDLTKITDSNLVKQYLNPKYNYTFLYPIVWNIISTNNNRKVSVISPEGEFIEIMLIDNPYGYTAENWYLDQIPMENKHKVEKIWANGFHGVKSLDEMSFYLTLISGNRSFIYSVSYIVGSRTQMSFPSTFQMITRSFDIKR